MDSTKQSPVVQTVTRLKHPGRVAHGKKLAALMKERKDALVKNKESEVGSEVQKEQSSDDHTSYSAVLGIILLICVAGSGIYFYSRKTPAVPPEKKERGDKMYGVTPIINMSKFDYKKELKESLIDASLLTVEIYRLAWGWSKVSPSLCWQCQLRISGRSSFISQRVTC